MFYLKKKKIKIIFFSVILILLLTISYNVFAIKPYYKLDFETGLVTATNLNVRSGPSTAYGIVTKVKKNEYIRVFARSRRLVHNSNRVRLCRCS